ncbi:MAG: putative DNA modification/repair radical SAM protein [Planctomycetota bacterium]
MPAVAATSGTTPRRQATAVVEREEVSFDKVRVKLAVLADAAKYDASCSSSGIKRKGRDDGLGSANGTGICHSYTPDGRCVSLLKILLTNYCIYDCQYCVNRVSSDVERQRFSVEEVVQLTLEFYRRNYIEGLFLSSGIIKSVDYTMEQLIEVARRLRVEHKFRGYIHLKAVPKASPELMAKAGLYADRLSANIELPTDGDLKQLAPEKKLVDAEDTMSDIKGGIDEAKADRKAPRFAAAGQSTQMIVGATPTPDREIIKTAGSLYKRHDLRRVYYTAFSPIPYGDARLPLVQPPLVREHRLYQSDWLMRFYGFRAEEITTPEQPTLDLEIDPKLAWALRNRHLFPVDLNRAAKWRLLRVPGLGQRTVQRLLRVRRHHAIRLDDLSRLNIPMRKVRPWVTAVDHNPATRLLDDDALRDRFVPKQKQLSLF